MTKFSKFLNLYNLILKKLTNTQKQLINNNLNQLVKNNIKNGLVYHASPKKYDILKGEYTGKWSGEQGNIFVTPIKGLAACFIIDKQVILNKVERQFHGKVINLNFEYDIWNKPIYQARILPKEIIISLNIPNLIPFSGISTGYLYTIDYTKYANKAHMFNKNPNSDVEFLIEGNVNYLFCEKITIRWKCITSENSIKRHGTAKIINKNIII